MDGRGSELQQVGTVSKFWWRTHDASAPSPAACPAAYAFPSETPARNVKITRTPPSSSAETGLRLQIPKGERRYRPTRRSARAMRRWATGIACVAAIAGAAAFVMTSQDFNTRDIKNAATERVTALMIATGFGIDQVSISGHRYALDSDIYDALDLPNVRTFAAFDAASALKRIERIPWVDTAQITRVFPGTLEIAIRERTPAVIWTRGNRNYLVDATGRTLGPAPEEHGWVLPHIVGEGGNVEAAILLAAVRRHPDIVEEMSFAERIAERRWRIVLKNGTQLDLAADREVEGLDLIANMKGARKFLAGTAMIVEVRTPGRITARPLQSQMQTSEATSLRSASRQPGRP
jgi:cell division protein FtsQ